VDPEPKVGPRRKPGPPKGVRIGGRKAGTPNKVTGQLKDMIMTALDEVGGVDYLKFQANENAKTFLLLLGRVLPMQVSSDPDQPFELVLRWGSSPSEGTSDPSAKS
jgi:hypothetical protein